MIKRNTIQLSLVSEEVKRLCSHPTADEVYASLVKEHPSISRGTVYRNLNRLCDEGVIRKIEIPDGADRFDSNCSEHYHIRCDRCGSVCDADMDYIPDMEQRVKDTHGFHLTGYDIIFHGICPQCGS